ncbi:MAG: substrate-binding domain-containing protein [Rhodospirillales bacterium]|jgi:molybdate transport system substrate-binding protein|nr:substrate-binding domain-containing protein [Rhodospirillales bacterium]
MTDIRILSAGAPKSGVRKCAEAFAEKTGQAFEVEFATAPVLKERVGAGQANADIIVAPVAAMQVFVDAGQVLAESVSEIGSVTAGVVIRNGAREPDLASVEAFKRDMLAADGLVYNLASSGQYIAKMIENLWIADEVASKTHRVASGAAVMEHLADGPATNIIGFGQITEIRLHEHLGVHLVGPLPEAIGKVTTYAVGQLADATMPDAARPLVDFMVSADGKQIFVATGVV